MRMEYPNHITFVYVHHWKNNKTHYTVYYKLTRHFKYFQNNLYTLKRNGNSNYGSAPGCWREGSPLQEGSRNHLPSHGSGTDQAQCERSQQSQLYVRSGNLVIYSWIIWRKIMTNNMKCVAFYSDIPFSVMHFMYFHLNVVFICSWMTWNTSSRWRNTQM